MSNLNKWEEALIAHSNTRAEYLLKIAIYVMSCRKKDIFHPSSTAENSD